MMIDYEICNCRKDDDPDAEIPYMVYYPSGMSVCRVLPPMPVVGMHVERPGNLPPVSTGWVVWEPRKAPTEEPTKEGYRQGQRGPGPPRPVKDDHARLGLGRVLLLCATCALLGAVSAFVFLDDFFAEQYDELRDMRKRDAENYMRNLEELQDRYNDIKRTRTK